jgi:hypothetical protein
MYNHPVEFLGFGNREFSSVLFYPFNGDKNIAHNDAFFFRIIKSDDIGIGIMIQVLLVYLQQVFV